MTVTCCFQRPVGLDNNALALSSTALYNINNSWSAQWTHNKLQWHRDRGMGKNNMALP